MFQSLDRRILCQKPFVRQLAALSTLFLLLMSLPGGQHSHFNVLRPTVSAASNFVVTTTDDFGAGSLRQAITDANANPGLDTISFNIGSGPKTISTLQRLPTVTDAVIIDGTTQPGFSGTPIIELNGTQQPDGNGLFLTGGNSTVRGLIINRVVGSGILIDTNGGNHVEGCFIGTDQAGTLAQPNGSHGISIRTSNNIIGGTSPTQRNVISGNSGAGIDISRFCCTGDTSSIVGNVIQGNYIGVNATGNAAIQNRQQGVVISSVNANLPVTNNLVGGTQPGAGNLISGNHGIGVDLEGFWVANNSVQGNFIGTDSTGSFAIPNDNDGIVITGASNFIGGPTAAARNVISGNGRNGSNGGNGVSLSGDAAVGNVVQGNIIGANATLTTPVPNFLHGVAITGSNSIIGGTAAGEGNVIAFNGYDGVVVATNSTAAGNVVRGNSIFSNGYLSHPSGVTIGIDLGNNGVTPNDAGDGDNGANNLQNFPVITSVTQGAGTVNIKGTLNSTASSSFSLDFYANSVCDSSGFGEGARLIGFAPVATDPSGNATFDFNFSATLPAGQVITATATNSAGSTSEFSQCSTVLNAVGSIGFSNAFPTVGEGDGFATFVVDRTGGSLGPITFNYDVAGLTAREGFDFGATHGTLTFADGETSKLFTVPIMDDTVDESSETARVTLSTTGDLDTLGSKSFATLTIADNDPTPSLSVGDVSLAEGDSGTTNFSFPVTLSAASERTVTVIFFTSDGTAVGGGTDFFLPATNSLTIPAGQTSANITIQVIGDLNIEPDETFFVNLTNATNAIIADNQAQGTILNDDSTPTVSLSVNDVSVVEGNSGTTDAVFTVTLSAPSSQTVTVDELTFGETASSPADFTNVFPSLSFAPGETTKTFAVPVVGDNIFEGNETFRVELRNPVHALISDGVGIGTIIDDESRPTLSVNDISIVEGDSGTKDATFTISLSGPSNTTVGFSLSLSEGTAKAQEDYSEVGGGLLIASGLTSTTITVPIFGDTITEPNETFFINLANPSNATIADGQGMATIIDNESPSNPPTVQFAAREQSVSEGAKSIAVLVTRSGNVSAAATVDYATSAQSNASDRSDYTSAFGKLSFAAGESSKTFTVLITDDVFVESDELFLVTLSNPTGGTALGSPVNGVVRIVDNDSGSQPNPIDNADFFVRQHYLDFLNREPDASGLAFWSNQITECQQSGATCDAAVRRINVSAAFFLSIEFQETGYLVEKLYKTAYSDALGTSNFGPTHQLSVPIVRLNEFLPDTQEIGRGLVVGQTGWEQVLENNKVAFILQFVQRTRFTTAFPATQTPAQFVDQLFARAGVTPFVSERTSIINEFGEAGTSADNAARGRALRRVAENSTLNQAEKNKAFVLMQFFGYLRRNPNDPQDTDYTGYDFWLSKLNEFNGDFIRAEMVKAFIESSEYRKRFGP